MKTSRRGWRRSTFNSRRLGAVCLLVLMAVAGACTGKDLENNDTAAGSGGDEATVRSAPEAVERAMAGGGGAAVEAQGMAFDAKAASVGGTTSAARGSTAPPLRIGPSIIKTASINVGVPEEKVQSAINDAIAVAGRHGGFVLSSQLGRKGTGGALTMRVPAQKFESALADLEALGKVRREDISGEDVGQEFVDLEARLRNWESQEVVLLRLMDRATSVIDTIRVQNELSRVQLEIEQLRGRLAFLRDQTSLATITATFGPLTPPSPDAPSRFAQAWSRALELMQNFVAGMIVTLGVVVPLAAIAAILYLLFRGLRPRLSA